MASDRNVVFRRIHGRIIPIKLNKQQKSDLKTGAGLTASGIAVGAASGKAYRAINFTSTRFSSRAFRSLERINNFKGPMQGTFFSMVSKNKAQAKALNVLNKGRIIGKFAGPTRTIGINLASTLATLGLIKLNEARTKKKSSIAENVAIGTAVGSAAFLTGGYGVDGLKSQSFKAKEFVKPFVPKIKDYAIKAFKARF